MRIGSRDRQYEVWVEYDVKIPLTDGINLSADVYRPLTRGPFPAIYHSTAYDNSSERFVQYAVYFASRGYAWVQVDCRGRFDSEGDFMAFRYEASDNTEALAWLCEQPWCDGNVGMWGRSFAGISQGLTAPRRPQGLKCLLPEVCWSNMWRDGQLIHGALQLALTMLWLPTTSGGLHSAMNRDLYDWSKIFRHLPVRTMDRLILGRSSPFVQEWLDHPSYDDYWRGYSADERFEEIDVPSLNVGGWFDAYPLAAFNFFNGMRQRGRTATARQAQRILMGPWTHGLVYDPPGLWPIDFGNEIDLKAQELRWFDAWLRGEDNGLLDEPTVRIFVMGDNVWRFEREWPLARTEFSALYLHSRGRANSLLGDGSLSFQPPGDEPTDAYDYDPQFPVPTLGGNHSLAGWCGPAGDPVSVGPQDTRPVERRDDVLVYSSEPLAEDVEVTGPLILKLYVASSAPDTDFTARLADALPSGYAMHVSEGILRARFRDSWSEPKLMERGTVYLLTLELQPTAIVFKRGHRLRLDISSSNFPRFDRNTNTGNVPWEDTRWELAKQTILHDRNHPSHLLLPIIPR
ncbi:MAG: CocE/NonD family hydrolase [Acidobacteria bacterium]|nr:CocE/NonD family hydrolase [Acidobacteriota bacterium]MCI0719860.1 CocE/NonD family hydrolase [Acidobacteriota bacterium]